MDQKDLIKYGLIAIGAYLIYKYVEANGGLSAVLGTTAAASTLPVQTPAQIAAAAKLPATPPPPAPATTPIGTTSTDTAGNIYSWSGSAWVLKTAALPPPPATTAAGCLVGQVNVNGTCIAQTTDPISQLMVGLASSSGAGTNLDFDQWNYFYSQATGNASPVDPGSIPPQVYHDAGVLAADGVSPGDRTTPMQISTWLAIMQNQSPSSGLSAFFGLGGPRYTPAWLM